jgi:hypothetical protein
MEIWQLFLMLTFQLIAGFMAIILAIFIYKRNPNYKGNSYLGLGFIFYSLYPFGCFFFEIGINEFIVLLSLQISLIGSIIGTMFFVLSMMIFCKSTKVLEKSKMKLLYFLISLLICIYICWPSSIIFISLNPTLTERSILLMILITIYIVFSTGGIILRLTKAIKMMKESDPYMTKNLKNFRLALIISFGILIFSVIENLTQEHFYNIFNYLFLLLTYILISQPLLKQKRET